MALREGATGSSLQIALKPHGPLFVGEFDRNDDRPRTIPDGVAITAVVPPQPLLDISGDAHVMSVRIDIAAKNVDEAFAVALHER